MKEKQGELNIKKTDLEKKAQAYLDVKVERDELTAKMGLAETTLIQEMRKVKKQSIRYEGITLAITMTSPKEKISIKK